MLDIAGDRWRDIRLGTVTNAGVDGAPLAGLDARLEGGPELEFWDMDMVVSEMRERLSW